MRRMILSVILILTLTISVSAHSGKTDSSGGHTDSETGEYHYHHGYSAHDHYDMDGDEDIDCPYDFDDQTGANSGTSSGSSSSSRSTTSTDYRRGYEAGHDDGYAEGKRYVTTTAERRYEEGLEEGLDEGRSSGYAEGYAVGYSKARTLAFWAAGLVGAFFLLLNHFRKDKHKAEIKSTEARYEQALDELRAQRDAAIAERDALASEQERVREDCRVQITRAHSACQDKIRETEDLCNAKIARIESVARLKIQACFLDFFDPQRRSALQFPKDIDFHRRGISRGIRTPERPFGDLTVYRTPNGRYFHTKRGCCGAIDAVCVYDERLHYVTGCSKCTDYTFGYREVPEWYKQYKLLLSGVFIPRENPPEPHKPESTPALKLGRDQQYHIDL